jgi:hypothetical protein
VISASHFQGGVVNRKNKAAPKRLLLILIYSMDRLVIESILADTNEIALVDTQSSIPCVCLGFEDTNMEQVRSAFHTLQNLTATKSVSLVICETLMSGIYDIEIVTDALDEPIRICNKVIEQQTLKSIREIMDKHPELILAVNGAAEDTSLKINTATYKAHKL